MRRPVLLLCAAAAACVAPPPPPREPPARPRPAPAPPPPIGPAPSADWRDRPLTPGTWTYARDARGSRALFGSAGADARLVLRCDRTDGRVFLSREGGTAAPLTVRTSSTARVLEMRPTGGTPAYVATTLAPLDPLLDALAFSRGKVSVSQAGAPTLTVPAWAEIGRVTEDCRP